MKINLFMNVLYQGLEYTVVRVVGDRLTLLFIDEDENGLVIDKIEVDKKDVKIIGTKNDVLDSSCLVNKLGINKIFDLSQSISDIKINEEKNVGSINILVTKDFAELLLNSTLGIGDKKINYLILGANVN